MFFIIDEIPIFSSIALRGLVRPSTIDLAAPLICSPIVTAPALTDLANSGAKFSNLFHIPFKPFLIFSGIFLIVLINPSLASLKNLTIPSLREVIFSLSIFQPSLNLPLISSINLLNLSLRFLKNPLISSNILGSLKFLRNSLSLLRIPASNPESQDPRAINAARILDSQSLSSSFFSLGSFLPNNHSRIA